MPYDKTAILNAINNASVICLQGKGDVQKIVEAIIGESLAPPKTYRRGTRFTDLTGHSYVLACVGPTRSDQAPVAMISLRDGNRYREPVMVENDRAITQDEMRDICGDNFTEEIPF